MKKNKVDYTLNIVPTIVATIKLIKQNNIILCDYTAPHYTTLLSIRWMPIISDYAYEGCVFACYKLQM